jgi:hypothetical protein
MGRLLALPINIRLGLMWLAVVNTAARNTSGGSITVLLTSCLTGLDKSVLQMKTKIISSHAADSKPVKQEVNGTVILPPLVFPDCCLVLSHNQKMTTRNQPSLCLSK